MINDHAGHQHTTTAEDSEKSNVAMMHGRARAPGGARRCVVTTTDEIEE